MMSRCEALFSWGCRNAQSAILQVYNKAHDATGLQLQAIGLRHFLNCQMHTLVTEPNAAECFDATASGTIAAANFIGHKALRQDLALAEVRRFNQADS